MADDRESAIIPLKERVYERTQGCWNCVHSSHDRAKDFWKQRRMKDLDVALGQSLLSPMGEKEPSVVNIRRMVDAIDVGLASGGLTKCFGPGLDANGNEVGDFVKSAYLCKNWSAAQGASVARAGQAPDPLPAELDEKTR